MDGLGERQVGDGVPALRLEQAQDVARPVLAVLECAGDEVRGRQEERSRCGPANMGGRQDGA